jgi:uncharacterized protein
VSRRGKATALGLVLQLLLTPALVQAQAGIDSLFPSRPTGYITDAAGAVDATSAAAIDSIAERLRAATGAELAVVTLPTIGEYAAVDVAVAIGRAWGVGRAAEIGDPRRNAGLVLLLVPRREGDPNSGQVFIATGQGLEGIVTDAAAGRVRDLMLPEFRMQQYGAGLLRGTRALAALVARGMGVTDTLLTRSVGEPGQRSGRIPPGLIVLVIVLAFLIVPIMFGSAVGGARGRRRGRRTVYWGGPGRWGGGGFGGGGFGGGGGGGFGGFGGGGGFSGGGAGGRF